MGLLDDLLRSIFGRRSPATPPGGGAAAVSARRWRPLGHACPQCGRRPARRRARPSPRRVAAVAREIVEFEAAHADERLWGPREMIAQAHGLRVTDVTDETIRIREGLRDARA